MMYQDYYVTRLFLMINVVPQFLAVYATNFNTWYGEKNVSISGPPPWHSGASRPMSIFHFLALTYVIEKKLCFFICNLALTCLRT